MSTALDLKLLSLEAKEILFELGALIEDAPMTPGELHSTALSASKSARKMSSLAHKERDPKKKMQLHKQAGFEHRTAAHYMLRAQKHLSPEHEGGKKMRKAAAIHRDWADQHLGKTGSFGHTVPELLKRRS